jgi:hypothetical protein
MVMEKKLDKAHWCFMASVCSWFIVMGITPVGGWSLHNPYRDYYMNAFAVTGVISLIALIVCILMQNKTNKTK